MLVAATAVAFLMIANQVAGKATRDALFLSNFDVTALPILIIAGSIVSIGAALSLARAMTRVGPAVFVPVSFGLSALLLLFEWVLCFRFPRLAAVVVFVHFAVFGSVLVSGFWSLINERIDPRSGKRIVSRIGTGATVGGLAGGIVAERVAALFATTTMLPVLALMHLLCVALLLSSRHLNRPASFHRNSRQLSANDYESGIGLFKKQPYLRSLGALVLLGTVSTTLIDYVFKAYASSSFDSGEDLLRFFAVFYTGTGLLTVILQGGVSRRFLQHFGLVKTAGTLPALTGMTALSAIFFPGLATVVASRATEAVTRNSLYRSAYELLYTPLPPREKRSTKALIDVGCERLGDAFAGGLIRALLFLGPALAQPLMLGIAVVLSLGALLVANWLNRGYVRTLERNLRIRAIEIDVGEVADDATRTVVMSVAEDNLDRSFVYGKGWGEAERSVSNPRPPIGEPEDPVVQKLAGLRRRNRKVLDEVLSQESMEPSLIPELISLLKKDSIAQRVVCCLRRDVDSHIGQLTDSLLDQKQPEAVRRRIPRVLGESSSSRAAEGLLLGLDDPRFEVRYQCGRALSFMARTTPELTFLKDRIFAVVLKEVGVKRAVWRSRQLLEQLDGADDNGEGLFVDDLVKDRASRSLEHVFVLFSLVLPREPLTIAYRGVHSRDRQLRGTALEYLESVLPEEIRSQLWPFLECDDSSVQTGKSRGEILRELINSDKSIQINLKDLENLDEFE